VSEAGVVSKLLTLVSELPDLGNSLAKAVSDVATLDSFVGDSGHFCWRRWSVAVAKVVSWLAVCTPPLAFTANGRWEQNQELRESDCLRATRAESSSEIVYIGLFVKTRSKTCRESGVERCSACFVVRPYPANSATPPSNQTTDSAPRTCSGSL